MQRYLVANWKIYLSREQSCALFKKILAWEKKNPPGRAVELVIAPPLLALPELAALRRAARSAIKLAAQNCDWAEDGAYTGMIAPTELKKLGCDYVLLGHSERRQWLHEDGKMLRAKIAAALRAGLRPIYCMGETKIEHARNQITAVLRRQIADVLVEPAIGKALRKIIIAYEPRWAIGSGTPVAAGAADLIHARIKKLLGENVPVLYGGSITSATVASYFSQINTAGVLVGGAAVKFVDWIKLVRATELAARFGVTS